MTPTGTREALLKDIALHPTDDSLRLIFADLCDDQGDHARAEFIRTSFSLAACPAEDVTRRETQLSRRIDQLLESHGYHWVNTPRQWPVSMTLGKDTISFRKGFVHSWKIRMADWITHGKELAAWHPIQYVHITDKSPMDNSTWGREDILCIDNDGQTIFMPPSPTRLPRPIWDALTQYHSLATGCYVIDGPNLKHYRGGRNAAMTALSHACLAWARS